MDQQTELTPVLRIATGIEFIQRGINDMDSAGVAAQALSRDRSVPRAVAVRI